MTGGAPGPGPSGDAGPSRSAVQWSTACAVRAAGGLRSGTEPARVVELGAVGQGGVPSGSGVPAGAPQDPQPDPEESAERQRCLRPSHLRSSACPSAQPGHQERILELPCRLELSGTFLPLGLCDLLGTRCLVQSSTPDSCCTHPGSLGMMAQMGRREDIRAAGVPSSYAHSVRLCHTEYFQGLPHGQGPEVCSLLHSEATSHAGNSSDFGVKGYKAGSSRQFAWVTLLPFPDIRRM